MNIINDDIKSKIKEIEKERESKVLIYITNDQNPNSKVNDGAIIAPDVLSIFYEHLSKIGKNKKISLILESSGGKLEAPWPLVNLIREYCEKFEVIIPTKALSAATLISLGADKILMNPISQLSPIDPIGTFESSENQNNRMSIEDVAGYLNFIKKKVGLYEQKSLTEALSKLTNQIKPTNLGSIYRIHFLIRSLAKNMLKLSKNNLSNNKIDKIVEKLTEKLFSHNHMINRNEAINNIGLDGIVIKTSQKEEKILIDISKQYKEKLGTEADFKIDSVLDRNGTGDKEIARAILHSSELESNFITKYNFKVSREDQIRTRAYSEWQTN